MQRVAAAAGLSLVKRLAKIVPAQKPFEREPSLIEPVRIIGCAEGFDAGGDHGVSLNWLLVEMSACLTAAVKSNRTNRAKVAGFRNLEIYQPPKRFESYLKNLRLLRPTTTQNQRVRKLRVVISHDILEPGPVVGRRVAIATHEVGRKGIADLIHQAIAAETAEVFVDANQCKRPRARRTKFRGDGERL